MAQSIPRQSSSALTAKRTGAKNAHNSLNLTNKIGKYTRTLSYKISVRVKGTTLPILVQVLAKFAQEKLLHKPRPFGLSVSRNLNWLLCSMSAHHWLLLVRKDTEQLLNYLSVGELMWMILIRYVSSVVEFIYCIHFPLLIWYLSCGCGDCCHSDISSIHVLPMLVKYRCLSSW